VNRVEGILHQQNAFHFLGILHQQNAFHFLFHPILHCLMQLLHFRPMKLADCQRAHVAVVLVEKLACPQESLLVVTQGAFLCLMKCSLESSILGCERLQMGVGGFVCVCVRK
jgi:hypothetical protein